MRTETVTGRPLQQFVQPLYATTRCLRAVHWWDCDLDAHCILRAGHTAAHSDGIRWFDDHGLQVPSDTYGYRPAHSKTRAGARGKAVA